MPSHWLPLVMLDDQRRRCAVRDRCGCAITRGIGKLLLWAFIGFNLAMTVLPVGPSHLFLRLSAAMPAPVSAVLGLLLGGLPFPLPVLVLVPVRHPHRQFHAHVIEPRSH
ncbi:MAG TPA: hypothetical protein VK726_00700 [Acetobacteraceae bacterium]|jgi:hypothetical protein|nr:hypothetical protein [Acetobacteraceae bacterium]